jgi:hypothetical protein
MKDNIYKVKCQEEDEDNDYDPELDDWEQRHEPNPYEIREEPKQDIKDR